MGGQGLGKPVGLFGQSAALAMRRMASRVGLRHDGALRADLLLGNRQCVLQGRDIRQLCQRRFGAFARGVDFREAPLGRSFGRQCDLPICVYPRQLGACFGQG